MENLLFNLLKGPLGSMGVSDNDLMTYITQCIGYVYAILAVLVVAIVLVIVGIVVKKGIISVSGVVACILAILIIANLVCFGPLKNNIAMFLNNTAHLEDATVQHSKEVIEEIGEEGMVLVENNGLLPLSSDVTNLNVFGWDSTNPIYGGTGSGSADTSGNIGILDSLKNAGYATNEELTKMYTDYRASRGGGGGLGIGGADWTLPEPTADYYTDAVISQATGFSDVALIVLGRSGGEGADLPTDMYKLITDPEGFNIASQMIGVDENGNVTQGNSNYAYMASSYTNNGDYNDFDEGEHYLEPSNTEEAMIDIVCQNFDKVILVINANNAMELGWVEDYPQIGAVILAPGTGATGFNALGKIIKGEVNPSGHTVDTYVRDLTATPAFNNIGNFTFNNVDDLRGQLAQADGAYEGNMAFVKYVEGIYVGYKFYETAYDEGMAGFNYDDAVVYPFGYGLSYTTFTQEIQNFDASGDNVVFDVVVSNTGSAAGKGAVEVYFTPPYTNGGIEKASVNLVDFAKTPEIAAGASETVHFEIPKEEFASYDCNGVKVSGGGYILEAGEYTVSVRSDSHTVLDSETFNVASDVAGRGSDLITATNIFQDYTAGDVTYLSRADKFANYAEATAAPADDDYVMDAETREAVEKNSVAGYVSTDYDDPADTMPATGAKNNLTLFDLRGVAYDDAKWDQLLDQMSVDDMGLLVNLGGWQTAAIDSVGKVATADCDGPAGVNNFITGNMGTGYPAEVLMAQTWSKEIATKLGDAMGQEYEDLNNFGWYGPAMNGHRSAFAGRNFEYYSEDGVLAGKFASNQVNAAAEHGVYAYIKHFFLNDQETNRCAFLLTYSNEQAMREIYAKPFEIVVKNFDFAGFKPLAVMSAFNWIGTKPACGNEDSLTTLLRSEWGFKGFVETDFNGSYGYMITEHCVRVGNDLKLGFYSNATDQITHRDSASQVVALRNASKNILYTIANSGYYANGNPVGGMDNMTKTFIIVDVIVAAIAIALEVIAIVFTVKKAKKKAA